MGFDVVLKVAIFELGSRWRQWLGIAVAFVVTLDAITTLTEAPQRRGVGRPANTKAATKGSASRLLVCS